MFEWPRRCHRSTWGSGMTFPPSLRRNRLTSKTGSFRRGRRNRREYSLKFAVLSSPNPPTGRRSHRCDRDRLCPPRLLESTLYAQRLSQSSRPRPSPELWLRQHEHFWRLQHDIDRQLNGQYRLPVRESLHCEERIQLFWHRQ
jgi:hypothetical protein